MLVFPDTYEQKVGFTRIREWLENHCVSSMGAERVQEMSLYTDRDVILNELSRLAEFQELLIFESGFPVDHYTDLRPALEKTKVPGNWMDAEELLALRNLLETLRQIGAFLKKTREEKYPSFKACCSALNPFPVLIKSIDRVLDKKGNVKDSASPELKHIRQEIAQKEHAATKKLRAALREGQERGWVDKDSDISIRNGRGVIPVAAADKRSLNGLIHDQSATGKTVYIEPAEIVRINNEINELHYDEKREIIRILSRLTEEISPYTADIAEATDMLGYIDFLRAKALFGNRLSSIKPVCHKEPMLHWQGAVHPGLFMALEAEGRKVVPLDISLDAEKRILLISGPNAGGKSVCLQTVGILQYMFQCGMTVPVREGSEFGVFHSLFIDIGDEQSIENDLSTYSSHLMNMRVFLKEAGANSLLLIDEFGTGTEPALGGAIAEAILAALNKQKCLGVITTHYANLKHFAASEEGLLNGAMLYDNHKMQPLFQLSVGRPGSSFAFEIARKMGIPEEILKEASDKLGEEQVDFDKHLKDVLRDKRYWENKRQRIRLQSRKLDELVQKYEDSLGNTRKEQKDLLQKAREEAEQLLKETNRRIENTIREIKEAQAEKEKTREVRKKLESFSKEVSATGETKVTDPLSQPKEHQKLVSKVSRKSTPQKKTVREGFQKGDKVQMEGSAIPGEVMDASGKNLLVAFGNMITTVKPSKLVRISEGEYKREAKKTGSTSSLNWDLTRRKNRFKPEIDLRGKRAGEALQLLQEFLDEAVMVQAGSLYVLHGKGDGILRQLIREYLGSSGIVRSYQDEHVDRGGSGITVVELDI